MGTAKRERQKANRQLRLEEMQKEQQRSKNKKRAIQISVLLVVFVVGAVVLSFLLSGDDDEDVATTDSTTATSVASDTTATGSATTAAGTDTTAAGTDTTATGTDSTAAPGTTVAGGSITGETPCPPADGSAERVTSFENPPPMCIDESKTYTADITYEGKGTLKVVLDAKRAPQTVNSFVVLARYHFYDGTECHRAIPGFVVQCGDPTGTGSGGPGYEFADELPAEGEYQIGSLAMANSGPDTNGSQFFLITGEDGAGLPPNYSLFGQAEPGQDELIAALDALGNPDPSQNGVPPAEPIVIESVTITES